MMQLLSDAEAARWCEAHALTLRTGHPHSSPLSGGGLDHTLRVLIPDKASDAVGLAYVTLMTGVAGYEEGNFGGAILWLRRWEIWSETIDAVGYKMLQGLRGGPADGSLLEEKPAMVFPKDAFLTAHACLSLPLLFQWDALYAPGDGAFLARVSHEGYMELFLREAPSNELLTRFGTWLPE